MVQQSLGIDTPANRRIAAKLRELDLLNAARTGYTDMYGGARQSEYALGAHAAGWPHDPRGDTHSVGRGPIGDEVKKRMRAKAHRVVDSLHDIAADALERAEPLKRARKYVRKAREHVAQAIDEEVGGRMSGGRVNGIRKMKKWSKAVMDLVPDSIKDAGEKRVVQYIESGGAVSGGRSHVNAFKDWTKAVGELVPESIRKAAEKRAVGFIETGHGRMKRAPSAHNLAVKAAMKMHPGMSLPQASSFVKQQGLHVRKS